ncbi:RloB family protein [Vibrio cholerae]|uniref:RloB family protein n=1 Tax=Vibrio cholerae TaxID=666 RepID=UPI000E0A3654|nr:RloB family protein [Vibrio cholerae]
MNLIYLVIKMSPKKRREPRSLKRKGGNKQPKIKIVAFCEGKNTEPQFLRDFSIQNGNGLVDVQPIPAAGVPLTIVQKAVIHKKELEALAAKSNDPIDSKFQVWAVYDRDEHPNIPQAFDMAFANDIKVAYSNPCFELWPMLHFREQNASIHRHALQKDLGKEIKTYNVKGSKSVTLGSLKDDYATARQRAININKRHIAVSADKPNPYTDVYLLFDEIIGNGKPSS